MSPKVTENEFVSDKVACAAWATVNDCVWRAAAEYWWFPAWSVAIVQVPAPNKVTTAPVEPAVAVVLPVTEHTAGVVVEKATTRPDEVDAETPNAAPPNVLFESDPNVIVCDERVTVNDDDVAEVSPGEENVAVKLPPAPLTLRPLNVATPDDAVAVLLDSDPNDEPVAIEAVTSVVESDVLTFPAESTTRTTGWVARAEPIADALPGCVWITSAAATPAVIVNVDEVTDPSADRVNVRL